MKSSNATWPLHQGEAPIEADGMWGSARSNERTLTGAAFDAPQHTKNQSEKIHLSDSP